MSLDNDVRLELYRQFLESGTAPSPADVAAALGESPEDVTQAFQRLAAARVIVLRHGTSKLLMANPLSAVPTRFRAKMEDGRTYFGNCIWDVLGIPAMLGKRARIEARCGECEERIALEAGADGAVSGDGVVHFAVPAAHWWDDIVFT